MALITGAVERGLTQTDTGKKIRRDIAAQLALGFASKQLQINNFIDDISRNNSIKDEFRQSDGSFPKELFIALAKINKQNKDTDSNRIVLAVARHLLGDYKDSINLEYCQNAFCRNKKTILFLKTSDTKKQKFEIKKRTPKDFADQFAASYKDKNVFFAKGNCADEAISDEDKQAFSYALSRKLMDLALHESTDIKKFISKAQVFLKGLSPNP